MTERRARITRRTPADKHNQVVRVEGGSGAYRRQPCPGCPWRVDNTGSFPAEAFRISAGTAADMALEAFGCHESGTAKPATCAGFLLRGAEHNLGVRLGLGSGRYQPDVTDGGHALHAGYITMAVANGVPRDDPALRQCRLSPDEET
jgi:hypothetical protein